MPIKEIMIVSLLVFFGVCFIDTLNVWTYSTLDSYELASARVDRDNMNRKFNNFNPPEKLLARSSVP